MAWKQLALGLGAAMLLAACADTKQGQDITVSGFLGDYSILKRGGEGQAAYVYIAPGADASRYDKIWLDAVTVWKDPGQARFKGVPQSDLQMLANAFYSTVHDKLSEDYEMVRGPTPGALRVQIALTDAEASNPGLDTISSIVPQLRLATRLSGLITEKPFFVRPYLCAERTMYRILAANQPVRERRNQRSHPCYTKPELVATGPNQTWSWDITRLRGPKRWTSFYLYVLLDIFSRCVVGWMVADRENAALAATLIEETCLKQGIEPQVLTLHSDRGAPMTSKCTAHLLADLGVTRSLSRPQVSDDNPFSEAQFKTLKYHPGFPGRFEDITAAIAFCRSFFPWYNTEHRHAGIAMLTPDAHHRAPDGSARAYPASRLGPSPRTLRRHPETRPASRSRDQPTRHFHNRRNESGNRRCLNVDGSGGCAGQRREPCACRSR